MNAKKIYNLRNTDCQREFTINSSNNEKFLDVLKSGNIVSGGAKWIKELKHTIANSFKKIRVSKEKDKPCKELIELFKERELDEETRYEAEQNN